MKREKSTIERIIAHTQRLEQLVESGAPLEEQMIGMIEGFGLMVEYELAKEGIFPIGKGPPGKTATPKRPKKPKRKVR